MIPAPPLSRELAAAANCAGAFLLCVLFVLLSMATVALHFTLQGLRRSRAELPEAMALLAEQARRAEEGTIGTTAAAVEPQVALASRVSGLRVGLRTLVRGPVGTAPGTAAPAEAPGTPPAGPGEG
jgi:hypothetical protein